MATIAPIPTMWPTTLYPSNSVNSKPINFKFGDMIKLMNLTYPESLKRIVHQEHELSTMKVPPINSYGNFDFHFLTM